MQKAPQVSPGARAIRRAGELLKQIEPGQGARDGKREAGAHPPLRTDAARDAGIYCYYALTPLCIIIIVTT